MKTNQMITINELTEAVWQWAVEKGWTERKVDIPEQVALIHSEASEMLEAWRNNEPISWKDGNGKPQGVASELADIVIRCCHYARLNNVNLGVEIAQKMEYNQTRPHKHGGKQG